MSIYRNDRGDIFYNALADPYISPRSYLLGERQAAVQQVLLSGATCVQIITLVLLAVLFAITRLGIVPPLSDHTIILMSYTQVISTWVALALSTRLYKVVPRATNRLTIDIKLSNTMDLFLVVSSVLTTVLISMHWLHYGGNSFVGVFMLLVVGALATLAVKKTAGMIRRVAHKN